MDPFMEKTVADARALANEIQNLISSEEYGAITVMMALAVVIAQHIATSPDGMRRKLLDLMVEDVTRFINAHEAAEKCIKKTFN